MKVCTRRNALIKFVSFAVIWILIKVWIVKQHEEESSLDLDVVHPRTHLYSSKLNRETYFRGDNVSNDMLTFGSSVELDVVHPKTHLYSSKLNRETYFRGDNVSDDMLAFKPPSYLPNFKNPCWYESVPRLHDRATKRLFCLPYFHLISMDKSGASDLWYRIAKHPHIIRPKALMNKETHWWAWKRFGYTIWNRNEPVRHFDWYLQHFDDAAQEIEKNVVVLNNTKFHYQITGEGGATTFWDFTGWNKIPQNNDRSEETAYLTPHCLRHLTPKVKLIIVLKSPADRLYSDYMLLHSLRSPHTASARGFHQDVQRALSMMTYCFSSMSKLKCLYNKEIHMTIPVRIIAGMYHIFLNEWFKVFPRQQIHILKIEDYSNDIKSQLRQIFNFLELEPMSEIELTRIESLPRLFDTSSSSITIGPMMDKTRRLLTNFYEEHNKVA